MTYLKPDNYYFDYESRVKELELGAEFKGYFVFDTDDNEAFVKFLTVEHCYNHKYFTALEKVPLDVRMVYDVSNTYWDKPFTEVSHSNTRGRPIVDTWTYNHYHFNHKDWNLVQRNSDSSVEDYSVVSNNLIFSKHQDAEAYVMWLRSDKNQMRPVQQ